MPWASCHVNLPMKNSAFSTPTRASVTITDVAAAANVSKSTVSLVLQGSPLVARDTAQRVRQAAESLGYVYNRRAADLRRQVTNVVGIVINDLANPFFAELLVGMQRRLDEAGFVSLMSHTDERLDMQERVLNSMREHNAAGLILCPVFGTPETLLESIRASGMPLVLTVRPQKSRKFDFVGINHEQGTRAATNHLIECGHRRIAFMGRAGAGLVYDKRRRGIRTRHAGAWTPHRGGLAGRCTAQPRGRARGHPSHSGDATAAERRSLLQRRRGVRRDE